MIKTHKVISTCWMDLHSPGVLISIINIVYMFLSPPLKLELFQEIFHFRGILEC